MADYKETTVSGSSFSRCRLIEIRNPYQQVASVTFTEERITNLADRILRDQPYAPMEAPYDPNAQIDLCDPVTLQPTGSSVAMSDFYTLLFSAYLHHAKLRDIELGRVSGAAVSTSTAFGTI